MRSVSYASPARRVRYSSWREDAFRICSPRIASQPLLSSVAATSYLKPFGSGVLRGVVPPFFRVRRWCRCRALCFRLLAGVVAQPCAFRWLALGPRLSLLGIPRFGSEPTGSSRVCGSRAVPLPGCCPTRRGGGAARRCWSSASARATSRARPGPRGGASSRTWRAARSAPSAARPEADPGVSRPREINQPVKKQNEYARTILNTMTRNDYQCTCNLQVS